MEDPKYCKECMASPCLQEGEGDPPRMHIKREDGDEDPPFDRAEADQVDLAIDDWKLNRKH